MQYEVELRNVTATPLLVVRRQTPLQELTKVLPEAYGVVWDFVRRAQVRSTGRNVAVYLNDRIDRMEVEAGVEVGPEVVAEEPLFLSATPAGRAAMTTHVGPYSGLIAAHQAVRRWCREHHHVRAGPNWEVYGHWNDDSEKLRTDVFYLLAAGA
jgi:effector-binding domain-containing protein